jgi:SAM-dependent methyltransferase
MAFPPFDVSSNTTCLANTNHEYGLFTQVEDVHSMKVTRGDGLIEGFLARQRAKMADRLISDRARNGRILDIGCGTTPYFLVSTQFQEKYGLEKVHETEEKELHGEKIFLRRCDINNEISLPYEDSYFDVVTMLAVFEHIDPTRLVTILREVCRIMKPGAQYIMTTPAAWTDSLLRLLAKLGIVSQEEIQEHKGTYNHKKIIDLLVEAGFSEDHIQSGYFESFMNLWVSVSK